MKLTEPVTHKNMGWESLIAILTKVVGVLFQASKTDRRRMGTL